MKENIDYERIPGENDSWNVRILKGDYTETVYRYDVLKLDEELGALRYSASIISTPDDDLTIDNSSFQRHIGDILFSILDEDIGK